MYVVPTLLGIAAAYLLLAGSRTRKVFLDVPPRGSELPARPLQLPDNTHKSVKAATAAGQSAYYEPNTSAGHVHTKIDALVGDLTAAAGTPDLASTATPLYGDDLAAAADQLYELGLYDPAAVESMATEVAAVPTHPPPRYSDEHISTLVDMYHTGDELEQHMAATKLTEYGVNLEDYGISTTPNIDEDFVSLDPVTYSEDLTTAADHVYELPSGAQVPESVLDHKMAYLEHKKAMHKPEKDSAAPPTKVPPASGSKSGEAPPKGPEISHQEDADPH